MRPLYILWFVSDESRCAVRSVMKEIREAEVNVADRVTIAELCKRWHKLQQQPLTALDFVMKSK
jgi:DNA-binding IscR family transcriptional regulator